MGCIKKGRDVEDWQQSALMEVPPEGIVYLINVGGNILSMESVKDIAPGEGGD